jgi:hypothetical protein
VTVPATVADLQQAGRGFRLDNQTPAAAQAAEPAPIRTAEPYAAREQALADYRRADELYWMARQTSAGQRLLVHASPDARPDAIAMKAASNAIPSEPFTGTSEEATARFRAWAQAARVLADNLLADRYRAPRFRESLGEFAEAAGHLAARLAGTAQDPARWAQVFTTGQPETPATAQPQRPAAETQHTPPGQGPAPDPLGTTATAAFAADRNERVPVDPPARAAEGAQPGKAAPMADRLAHRLASLAASHGLAFEVVHASPGPGQVVAVVDGSRTVLIYSELAGPGAYGFRIGEADVPAYLAAYQAHPDLPPPALLDLLRQPDPVPLPLRRMRELAERHGLKVRIERVSRRSYITLHEPGQPSPPVLSYPAGSDAAFHGPCTVPVSALDGYLTAYRRSIDTRIFADPPDVPHWERRIAQLTPHLVDGSGHYIQAVRDSLHAALRARRDDTGATARYLDRAENAAPSLTLTPEREAQVTQAICDNGPGYQRATGDPARYIAEGHVSASDREQDWISAYIAAHPEVTDGAGVSVADQEHRRKVDNMADRAAAEISRLAHRAFEAGQYEQALSLLDDAELHQPGRADTWERRRVLVREAMARPAVADATPVAARSDEHLGELRATVEHRNPATATPAAQANGQERSVNGDVIVNGPQPLPGMPDPGLPVGIRPLRQDDLVVTGTAAGSASANQGPAGAADMQPTPGPLTDADLAFALRRISAHDFDRLVRAAADPRAAPVHGHGGQLRLAARR